MNDTSQDADGFDDDEDFDAASDPSGFERDEIIELPKDKPIPIPKKQPTQNDDGFEDATDEFEDDEMAKIDRELKAIDSLQAQLLLTQNSTSDLNSQQPLLKSSSPSPNKLTLTEGVHDSILGKSQTSFLEAELQLKTDCLLDQVDPLYKKTFPSQWPAILDQ